MVSCLSLDEGLNTLIKESVNNKQTKKAVLFIRQSGATVADSYQVTIIEADKEFDERKAGNTFTVEADANGAMLDSSSINFTWLTADTLQINYDKKLRTFIKERYMDSVVVIYVTQ